MQRRASLQLAAAAALLAAAPLSAAAFSGPARAILVTSGSYRRYRRIFFSVIQGLCTVGLIARAPASEAGDTGIASASGTADLWAWLAQNAGSRRLVFLPDGHYDYELSPLKRESVRAAVAKRLAEARDVDLILTLGNEATAGMFRLEKRIPILALGSTDAVGSGLARSLDDSGQDNLHVGIMVNYFEWQTRTFFAVRPFKRLGLISAATRWQVSGASEVRRTCEALGAEFLFRSFPESDVPGGDARAAREAIEWLLARGVDALVLPAFKSSEADFHRLVELLESRRISSFSQSGPELVRRGILLGVAESTFESYGLFEAENIRRVIEREQPRRLKQTYYQRGKLVVNLFTAMKLGWRPPFGLIASAEAAYPTQSITLQ